MQEKLIIAICDDVLEDAESLKKIIESELSDVKFRATVICYTSPLEMLNNIESVNIVFLDWMMDELDGTETAKRIKQKNSRCLIVAETGCGQEMFHEIVESNVITHVGKPFHHLSVRNALNRIEDHLYIWKTLQLYHNYEKNYFRYSELTVLKAYDGYVIMQKDGKEYRTETSLSEIYEDKVDTKMFALLNRNSLFYLGYIKEYNYEKNYVILKNDEKIKIPEAKKREFRKKYAYFDTHIKRH